MGKIASEHCQTVCNYFNWLRASCFLLFICLHIYSFWTKLLFTFSHILSTLLLPFHELEIHRLEQFWITFHFYTTFKLHPDNLKTNALFLFIQLLDFRNDLLDYWVTELSGCKHDLKM